MTRLGCDYAFYPHPDPSALVQAGYGFAARYIGPGTLISGKRLGVAESKTLHAAGLDIGLLVEGAAGDIFGGYPKGIEHARMAKTDLVFLGVPDDTVIYYSADKDITSDNIIQALGYCQGFLTVFPPSRLGCYGDTDITRRLLDLGWITRTWLPAARSWSPGLTDYYDLDQQPGEVNIGGGSIDVDIAQVNEWGQWKARQNPMAYFLQTADGSQYMADSAFERIWAFNSNSIFQKVYAAAGKPASPFVLPADIQAGTYGEYMGIYTLPRKAPVPAGSLFAHTHQVATQTSEPVLDTPV